jgi:hypothetical protein
LWFLGYDLDSAIPHHSVLSKARKRWGVELFQYFFERIARQCVEAGLVDGRKLFLDSSLVEAGTSKNLVIDTPSLKARLLVNEDEKAYLAEKSLEVPLTMVVQVGDQKRTGPADWSHPALSSHTRSEKDGIIYGQLQLVIGRVRLVTVTAPALVGIPWKALMPCWPHMLTAPFTRRSALTS